MPNTLGFYDPMFYAQEALIALEKNLCFAARVHRGYDASPQQKGSTINISKPGTFVAQDAPNSTVQDVNTTGVSITLDQWKEVTFALSDKELSFTKEKIISDHIRPAAYALANQIDASLASALYKDLYTFSGTPGTAPSTVADIVRARRLLQDNNVPDDGQRHFACNTATEENFLQLSIFNQNPAAGVGVEDVVKNGHLGSKFGMELFASQNIATHTAGDLAAGAGTIQVTSEASAGAATITLKGSSGTLTGSLKYGDIITFAGQTQTYVVTQTVVAAGNAAIIAISPSLKAGVAANTVVSVKASHANNIAFHRNCFALATAPLSEIGAELGGVKMASVADAQSNLSIRSRMWYEGRTSKTYVSLDILYGFKTLDPSMGVRIAG